MQRAIDAKRGDGADVKVAHIGDVGGRDLIETPWGSSASPKHESAGKQNKTNSSIRRQVHKRGTPSN